MTRALFVFLALVSWRVGAEGKPAKLVLDSSRTSVSFLARTTFHEFTGLAPGATGTVLLSDGRPVSGEVAIPTDRIRTGSDGRDQTMRGPEFLDAARVPAIQFQLSRLDGQPVPNAGQASGRVQGVLHIKDTSKEMSVPVSYGWDHGRLEVKGTFPLDIRDFALPIPVVFLVQRMDPRLQIDFVLTYVPATP